MSKMKSGWAVNAHLTSLYPIPEGPGADFVGCAFEGVLHFVFRDVIEGAFQHGGSW